MCLCYVATPGTHFMDCVSGQFLLPPMSSKHQGVEATSREVVSGEENMLAMAVS